MCSPQRGDDSTHFRISFTRLALPRFGYMQKKVRGAPARTNLGKTVKTLRERRDLSQSMLAKRARLTQPYLAQIERGVRTNPSLETLRSIARALRVSVNRLIR
jgi:DNA-binding XRE family transcriptional regulator